MELNNLNDEKRITKQEEFENLNFEGKIFCYLKEEDQLQLKATKYSAERNLGKLDMQNPLEEIKPFIAKFKELKDQVNDLEKEWDSTEDKLKLDHKIHKVKDVLLHTGALGDIEPLFEQIEEKQKQLNAIFEENYIQRLKIVEQAEAAVAEKNTNTDFRIIKEDWKTASEVRKGKYNELSTRFEKAENEFYNQKRKAYEEKEHEQMQNLDRKMDICERAEKVMDSEDWRKTTETYKELLEEWKTVGMVPSLEKNEELWNRFNVAKNSFFERKKEHSIKIRMEQDHNLALKTALIEKAEVLKNQTDWKNTTIAFEELIDEWKKIGKVPFEKADELWERLQAARNSFFSAKRESAQSFKAELEENYQKKQVLVEKAETLKNATDWFETTTEMNELMNEWKKIGPVPKSYGDGLWEQFIAARKYFFDQKDQDREKRKSKFHHQINNRLHQTVQFLDKITAELENDEKDLAEFTAALENTIGESAKEKELKIHLQNLIQKIEQRIPAKRLKVEDVKKQKEELSAKCKEVNERARTHNANENHA